MNDFSDLLRPEAVYKDVAVAHKKALFAQLATAAEGLGIDGRLTAELLAAREKIGSTGFGGGVDETLDDAVFI